MQLIYPSLTQLLILSHDQTRSKHKILSTSRPMCTTPHPSTSRRHLTSTSSLLHARPRSFTLTAAFRSFHLHLARPRLTLLHLTSISSRLFHLQSTSSRLLHLTSMYQVVGVFRIVALDTTAHTIKAWLLLLLVQLLSSD